MAKKAKTIFFCSECGYESQKWLGQCPGCHSWNTMVEEAVVEKKSIIPSSEKRRNRRAYKIDDIELINEDRMESGFSELDRVLGGGIVRASMLLLGGDPGIGKSTILLQLCRNLSDKFGKKVLYISGEESLKQIKMRAERIGEIKGELYFLSETDMDTILSIMSNEKPDFCVIDSIQTMISSRITSAAGSVSQVRDCTALILRAAKELDIATCLVGHVTKDGNVAGPRILEHMVDAVLYFEGEKNGNLRILHGQKNRFGSTDEIAVFEMESSGLKQIKNPSQVMLDGRPEGASGSVVSCCMEGTRPLLMEIQGLAVRSSFGLPRRTATGIEYNRLNLLIAIIEKRLNVQMSSYDAYVNVTGGLKLSEPSMDLAIIIALISSLKDQAVPEDIMIFGEVGLSGEVRAVSNQEMRIEEARRMGFSRVMMPYTDLLKIKNRDDIEIITVKNIGQAIRILN